MNKKTLIGQAATADFVENTYTFEINGDFTAMAGTFAIMPFENFEQIKNLVNEALVSLELQQDKIDTEIFFRVRGSFEKIKDLTI